MALRLAHLIAGVALVAVTTPAALELQTSGQQDARTASDLDHPHTFAPKFATRQDWLVRRGALRQQVLVAVGLWPMPPRRVKDEERLPAYNYGYNRAVLAERVRDLFTTIAFAKEQHPRAIQLIAFERAGVWALLTRALAGDTIARASIDLDGFEFTAVRDPFDPMMLPGALKYGGIAGLLPLLTSGQTELYRLSSPAPASQGRAPRPATVSVRRGPPDAERMARWLLGS